MLRPICAHCGATMPAGSGPCAVKPDDPRSRRWVATNWVEDGEVVRSRFPAVCLQSESAVGGVPPGGGGD